MVVGTIRRRLRSWENKVWTCTGRKKMMMRGETLSSKRRGLILFGDSTSATVTDERGVRRTRGIEQVGRCTDSWMIAPIHFRPFILPLLKA